jgi:hypothetical protein
VIAVFGFPVFGFHEGSLISVRIVRRDAAASPDLGPELATIRIAEFDAETRFRAFAGRGSVKKGLAILDKLDAAGG